MSLILGVLGFLFWAGLFVLGVAFAVAGSPAVDMTKPPSTEGDA